MSATPSGMGVVIMRRLRIAFQYRRWIWRKGFQTLRGPFEIRCLQLVGDPIGNHTLWIVGQSVASVNNDNLPPLNLRQFQPLRHQGEGQDGKQDKTDETPHTPKSRTVTNHSLSYGIIRQNFIKKTYYSQPRIYSVSAELENILI